MDLWLMEPGVITQALAERIELYEVEAHLSRMSGIQQMPGNPLGVEIQRFGSVLAFIVRGAPYLAIARVLGLGPEDEDQTGALLAWFRERQISPLIDISPYHSSESMFRHLAEAGLFQSGFLSVLYCVPDSNVPPPAVGITIRSYPPEDLGEFSRLTGEIDGIAEADQPKWVEVIKAQLHGWINYIAFVDGQAAGHASMRIQDGSASLMYAVTKPEFRGLGAQTALLHQRIADAADHQCDLVFTASYPGTISQRNQMRVGMRLAYTKSMWKELNRLV